MTLFLALTLAVGLDRLHRVMRNAGSRLNPGWFGYRFGITAISLLLALAFVTLLPRSFRSESILWPEQLPSGLARHVPNGGVVLAYPFPLPAHDEAMLWQASSRMHFRLIGGYAYIPGSAGAQLYPALEHPTSVQRILGGATDGALFYGPAPALGHNVQSDLRRFIVEHSVDGIIVWPGAGSDPSLARRYVTSALGSPTARFGTAEFWSTRELSASHRTGSRP